MFEPKFMKHEQSLLGARLFSCLLAAICALLVATSSAFAQGTRGTISGTVTDSAGAAVPGATVKLIFLARNQEVRAVTANDTGEYQLLEVEPASYDVVITATGFAEARISKITVEPNRNVRLDPVQLGVAGTTATVEVTAAQELLDRESGTRGTSVEGVRIMALPLNGRNILDLALGQPGVTTNSVGTIRANGARAVENNFQLDGSNNNEIAVGGQTGAQPRPDSVQEFRLLTSNYEAEFGRNSGAVINVVTKSGTNDFHGNVRAFYRPTVLSAARFFDQNANQKPREGTINDFRRRFERKEFGGNIGGPIYLPHFGEGGRSLISGKNRAFFFADYEGRRQLIGSTLTLSNLPSAEEKAGIFTRSASKPLIDPATAAPFPIISSSGATIRQQIPSSRFSPIGQYYIGFIPTGNASGSATVGAPEVSNFDQLTFRVDPWNTNRQTLGFTFSRFNIATQSPFPFFPTTNGANVPGFASVDLRKTYNAVLRHTFTFSPTVVNSFLAGYARNGQPSLAPVNKTTPAQIGFTANFVASPASAGPPFIFLDDRGIRLGNTFQGPQTRYTSNFQIQDSLSWARGDHRFKFGIDGTKYLGDTAFLFINQAIIGYGSQEDANTTGNDLADLLIGNSPGYIQFGSNGERDFRQFGGAFFGQDTWRFTDTLTLSLGLRWEYVGPLTDKGNRVAYYRPTAAARGISSTLLSSGLLRDAQGRAITVPAGRRAPIGLLYPGDPDPDLGGLVPDGGVNRDLNNFAPRFGFAYSPKVKEGSFLHSLMGDQQTVIRGGFGVFYGAIVGDTALQQLTAPGYQGTNAYFEEVGGTLANPFGPDPFPNYGNSVGNGFGVCTPARFVGCGTDLTQPTIPNPFISGGAEQVGVSLVTRTALGGPTRIANTSRAIDPFIRTPYTYQYNLTFERSFLKNYVASVAYVGNRGRKLYAIEQVNYALGVPGFFPYGPGQTAPPGATTPSTSGGNVNARRANPDFALGISQQVAAGNSWYNSLQVNVSRRYANGLLFQVAYTHSKSLTDTAGTDTNRGSLDAINRNFGKGLSPDDVPNRLTGSFVYDVPFQRWLGFSKNGPLNTVFGGWGIGGIYTAESGRTFFVNNLSNTTGTGGGVISLADLGDPFTLLDPRANNTRVFNPTAFKNATLACGTLACARRGTSGVNQFRVPNRINNWDLIVSKKTKLWSETTGLELRFEAFNAMNHTQFTTLNTTLPAIGTDPAKSNFGKFTAARESRVIQLGARFSF
jgi:hypothetical protein